MQVLEVLLGLAGAQLLDVSRDPPERLKQDGSVKSTEGKLRKGPPLATGVSYLLAPGVTQDLLVLGRGAALGQGT